MMDGLVSSIANRDCRGRILAFRICMGCKTVGCGCVLGGLGLRGWIETWLNQKIKSSCREESRDGRGGAGRTGVGARE